MLNDIIPDGGNRDKVLAAILNRLCNITDHTGTKQRFIDCIEENLTCDLICSCLPSIPAETTCYFAKRKDLIQEYKGGASTSPREDVGEGDHYILPITAACLLGLINVLSVKHGFNISFGDMSSSNGSDPWQAGSKHHAGNGHRGKRSGIDVDFRYLNTDGVSFQSANAFKNDSYSLENNQIVFDTAKIFGFDINYQGTSGNIVGPKKAGGHNDHGHLGLTIVNVNWKFTSKKPGLNLNINRFE